MFWASDVLIATRKYGKWHFGAKKVLGYLQSVSPKYASSLCFVASRCLRETRRASLMNVSNVLRNNFYSRIILRT